MANGRKTCVLTLFALGQYAFYPVKLSRLAKKNKVCRNYPNFKRGTLVSWVGGLFNQAMKNFIIFKGKSLEYCKSSPKPKPKYTGEQPPTPVFRHAQIGQGK